MMTLKTCLAQTDWSAVRTDLMRFFPDQAENIDSFHAAYEELMRSSPDDRNMRISIGRFAPNSVLAFYVVGFNGDCPKGYCLKFIPWSRWLSVKIDVSLLEQYRYSEIVAICLYDMCWAGFNSEEVESFRNEFIEHENCLWAILGHEEMIKDSEPNLIKRKQRIREFNQALNLSDIDDADWAQVRSREYDQARFDMEVQIYCLGETETDYDSYCAKVAQVKEDFSLRWPDPGSHRPSEH